MAVETAGTCIKSAIEPVLEIGKSITAVTEDTMETVSLFQWLCIVLQS